MKRSAWLLFCGLFPAAGLVAQEESRRKDAQERDPVVVTATRIPEEEAVKAGAVTAFSGGELHAAQIGRTVDLGPAVPGLQTISTQRRSQFFGMRGLTNGSLGEVPVVGLYLDDVPYTDWRNFDLDLYDVESVTVYRGPQPTAFGKAAEAGAISVRTRPVPPKPAGDVFVRAGSFGLLRSAASVRGPIAEKTAGFSLAGIFDRCDGFVDNAAGRDDRRENLSGRARVEVSPVDPFSAAIVVEGQRARDGIDPYSLLHQDDPYKVAYDEDSGKTYESFLGAARLAWQNPWFEVLSVTSRRTFDTDDARSDFDFSPYDVLILVEGRSAVSWSQEIRLDTKDRFKEWRGLLGVYGEAKDTESLLAYQIDDPALAAALGIPFPVPVQDRQIARTWGRTLAAFGEFTYTIDQQYDFTLGGRYESCRVRVHKKHQMESFPAGMTVETAPRVHDGRTDDVLLPKAAFAYRPTADLTAYALFSGGWRPAGYSQISDDPALIGWDPERIWNFEAGLKSAWCDRAVQANVSFFWQEIHDLQVRRLVGMTEMTNVNADEARSLGMELEIRVRPVGGVELGGGLGLIRARFEDFTDPNGVVFDGNRLPMTPRYDYSIYGQYVSDGWLARLEWAGVGRYYYDEWNRERQVAYGLLHARVGYEVESWGIYFVGWNLLDETYHPYGVPSGFLVPDYVGYLGAPRQLGVEMVIKF